MIISNCPRCHEEFRVPESDVPEDVSAVCPWCRETFPIAEVLRGMPPMLQLVTPEGLVLGRQDACTLTGSGLQLIESPAPPIEYDSRDFQGHKALDDPHSSRTASSAPWDDDHVELDVAELDSTELDSTGLDGTELGGTELEGPEWGEPDAASLQSMNVSTKSTARGKRKGSGIGTLVGIVLGGLMSIPIAGVLLMLFGRTPDWGFWPFSGEQGSSAVRAAPLPSLSSRADPTPPFADEVTRSQDEGNSSANDAFEAAELDVPRVEPDTASAEDPAEIAAQEILRSTTQTALRTTASEPSEQSAPNDSEADPSVAIPATPITQSMMATRAAELAAKATQMIEALSKSEVSASERERRLILTYQTIASATGLMDQDDRPLHDLAERIVQSPLLDAIGSTGWQWLESDQRPSSGIALIGRIVTTEDGQVLVSDSGDAIELLVTSPLPEDEDVLVLGHLDDHGKYLRVLLSEPIP